MRPPRRRAHFYGRREDGKEGQERRVRFPPRKVSRFQHLAACDGHDDHHRPVQGAEHSRPADEELRNVVLDWLLAHVRVHRGRDLPLHLRWVAREEDGAEARSAARLRRHRVRQRHRRGGGELSRPDRVAAHRGHRVRARHRCGTSCNREVRLARQPRNRERNLGPLDLPGFSHRVHGDPGRIRGPRDEGERGFSTPRSSPSPPWPLPYSCGR